MKVNGLVKQGGQNNTNSGREADRPKSWFSGHKVWMTAVHETGGVHDPACAMANLNDRVLEGGALSRVRRLCPHGKNKEAVMEHTDRCQPMS